MNYILQIISCALFIFISSNAYASGHGSAPEEDPNKPHQPVVDYYEMKPYFITNLSSTGNKINYIKVKIVLVVNDSRDTPLLEKHDPILRDTIVTILGAAKYDELKLPSGRDKLLDNVKESLIKVSDECIGRRVLKKVLFSEYLIQ